MAHMKMVDMRMDQKEKAEMMSPSPPDYPFGLCISLCQDELEKLGLLDADIEVGDMLHLQIMTKVTSYSENDNEVSGPTCRVELQVTHIGGVEDEDTEDQEDKGTISRLYRL